MVSKKEKYLVSAQKFMERGQLDKAVAEFAKVVEEDPKDTRTLLKLAEVHAKRGANAEATQIYLRTGDLYAEQGFAQKAVAVYKNVLKLSPALSPESVHAHLKVATLFVQLGLVSDAVQQFELAAAGLQRGSKPSEVVAALRQAVEIQPDNVVLRVKLAEGASHAGLIDEAVREFGVAADQLKLQGRLDESLRVMERLLFHQPDNFAKARELAEAYVAKGAPRLALPKLQACLNLDPHDPAILSLLARALELLGQIPKAVSVLKELVRLCEELGRPSERDAAVLRGLTLDPGDEELREAASRQQPLGEIDPADESTPPPVVARSVRTGTESSGVVIDQTPAYRSDRVWEPASLQATSRGQQSRSGVSGVSLAVLPDVGRILAEAEVFVKYGLLDRAADHLARVFESDSEPQSRSASEAGLVASAPVYREVRQKLIAVLQQLGRREDAAHHAAILAASLAEDRQAPETPDGFDGNGHGPREISLDFDPAQIDALAPPSAFSSSGAGAVGSSSSSSSWSGPTRSLEIASDGGQDFDAFDDPAAGILTPPPTPRRPEVGARQVELDVRGQAEVDGEADADADASWPQKEHTVTDDDIKDAAPSGGSQEERQAGLEDGRQGRSEWKEEWRQQDDPSRAFSDDVPTITGDPELAVEALAEVDEQDLDAELAQVSFFLDQAMTEEARALLEDLQARFPADPRIMARVRELRNSDFRALAQSSESITTARIVHQPTLAALGSLGATAIDRPSPRDPTPTPRVVVPGGESDSATHADLAIAYKGMGLLDAAIAELKLLVQDPAREVFALTTMGECFEGKGSFTEAIIRYKRALNCEQITTEETLVLYFLLGAAFERLGDVSEALYFFEKVLKRDPRFRDVDLRVAGLRPRLVKRAR